MTYTKEQLIEALYREYLFLIHDDYDESIDATPEEYLDMLKELTYDDLIVETQTDDVFTLKEFMNVYCDT